MPRWPLTTVISGGQTGADQAGLSAGKESGYKTGGMVPKGCRTEAGDSTTLRTVYGCVESASRHYKPRTVWNVQHSDGTVIFGSTQTEGTAYTIALCQGNHKPWIDNPTPTELREWIYLWGLKTLNVAGNRESNNPGIFERARRVLLEGLIPF